MGFVTLPCASAITCGWPPRAGRLEWTGNPRLLEAKAYALLAMSEWGHLRRLARAPNWSGETQSPEVRSALRHFGIAPIPDLNGSNRRHRIKAKADVRVG
jgi:hypothetical protein